MNAVINHMTWGAPGKDELKQMNKQMVLKAIRILLSALIISACLILTVLIRFLDLSSNMIIGLTGLASLPVIFYYWAFRNALVFGKRYALDDEIRNITMTKNVWFVVNLAILCPLFLVFAHKVMVLSLVLIGLMAVLTYWKELFMLILFILKKYTVKDGDVYNRQKIHTVDRSAIPHSMPWSSLVYLLSFEDAAGREIPVMVDWSAYAKFKDQSDALIINYKYKESYLFEIIRLKR